MSNTYQYLQGLMYALVTAAAESSAYENWGSDYGVKNVRETWKNEATVFRKEARQVTLDELRALSLEELRSLGFSAWDESGLILIPLWAWNYIKADTLIDIFGAECEKATADLDHRGGCTAFGFKNI